LLVCSIRRSVVVVREREVAVRVRGNGRGQCIDVLHQREARTIDDEAAGRIPEGDAGACIEPVIAAGIAIVGDEGERAGARHAHRFLKFDGALRIEGEAACARPAERRLDVNVLSARAADDLQIARCEKVGDIVDVEVRLLRRRRTHTGRAAHVLRRLRGNVDRGVRVRRQEQRKALRCATAGHSNQRLLTHGNPPPHAALSVAQLYPDNNP